MLTAVIIEDEKPAARRLQRMLEHLNIQVTTQLHSVQDAVNWFEDHSHPELIFLDIQLSDGLGFEIFEKTAIKSPIIFTTAYDEFTLRAFKLNSIDYLLKPIIDEDLAKAVDKYRTLHQQKTTDFSSEFEKIKNLLQHNKTYKERFTVYIGSQIKWVDVSEIACFVSMEKNVLALTQNGKTYPIEGSLDQILAQINPKLFFRVNRKFIVQLAAIQEIISYSNARLQIKITQQTDEPIIVSRERVKEFKEWLG